MRVKLSKLISLASLAKDPQNWISLIAVMTLLGFGGGVFDPHEGRQGVQLAQAANGPDALVVLQAQADASDESL